MGPLSKVWLTLEGAMASKESQQEISLEEMVQCIEQNNRVCRANG